MSEIVKVTDRMWHVMDGEVRIGRAPTLATAKKLAETYDRYLANGGTAERAYEVWQRAYDSARGAK
jgi:hypothetical protein